MSAGEQVGAGNLTEDAEATPAGLVEQHHVEQVPFLDQTFYTGPFVKSLGGADISWIVGFGVASLLYLAGAKRFAGGQRAVPATADPVGSAS